jgi:hypothetical protein
MTWLFMAFTALVVGGIAVAMVRYFDSRRRTIGLVVLAAWVLYTGSLGALGVLANPTAGPPRIMLILIPIVLFVIFLARSHTGRDLALSLPISLLIGAQAFRVIVEVFIHQLWSMGLLPKMLTYEGANFDIAVGVSAPVVAALLAHGRLSIRIVLAWNVFGLVLLANIIVRAILTTPAFQALITEVPNRALGMFPFTFIPGLMAPLGLVLHVLAIRALIAGVRAKPASQPS